VRAVWSFLTINDIEFEFKQIELIRGGHKTQEYLEKVNPAGKIPVMECGSSLKFMESHAMLRFIQAKYGKEDHWYPKEDAL
jgi:glutathione S-transferase